VVSMWSRLAAEHPDQVACYDPHRPGAPDLTYAEVEALVLAAGSGLTALGLRPGQTVALLSEASSRWIVADQGVMAAGGVPAVRGSTAPVDELGHILAHAGCAGLVVQDAEALARLLPVLLKPDQPVLGFIVTMWGEPDVAAAAALTAHAEGAGATAQVVGWEALVARGRTRMAHTPFHPAQRKASDVATIVYTSGTSGHPRGVMLTHGNLQYQVDHLSHYLHVRPGDTVLSLLPPWHIYQRTAAYYVHSCAGRAVFTSVRKLREDLPRFHPDHLVAVPLVLDSLHAKIVARLQAASAVRRAVATTLVAAAIAHVRARRVVEGTSLQYAVQPRPLHALLAAALMAAFTRPLHWLAQKLVFSKVREAVGVRGTIISGGGSLAAHLDDFFEAAGISVLNGWGMTETSPVLACRRTVQNVRGSVGVAVPGTELRVVDPATLEPVPDGTQGLVLARGPGVMAGYAGDAAATAAAFRAGPGWLDTGDLGWRAPQGVPGSAMGGVVVLTGRAKDTIVLVSGKNVEPQPIEDAVCGSPLIRHALALGQDRRELGLLIFPDYDALEAALAERRSSTAGAPTVGPSPSSPPAPASAAAAAAAAPKPAQQAHAFSHGTHPLLSATSVAELEALLLPIAQALNAARLDYTPEQHIAHVGVVVRGGGLTPEDGTLTRTMKPRRAHIAAVYTPEVEALAHRLRG